MKKTLSLILALLMAASTATFALADEAEAEVTAIAEEAVEEEVATQYDDAIKFLNYKKIMIGDENGNLMANDSVKRYQMALFMGRSVTGWVDPKQWEDGESNSSAFTDLKGDVADYLGAISYVNQKGIIVGYGDGTFGPDNLVTYRDALTMAVRTLGYDNGYDYPWDYIEKAVALGLTEGITDVTYTQEITRGVAAQIVYNMLFAENSDGTTLAKKSFGADYGWETIMVTADKYTKYVENYENGYAAFNVVNEDGTIDTKDYYIAEEVNGITFEYGKVYNALFEINAANDFVEMVDVKEYDTAVVENVGYTDDNGDEYATVDNIGEFLKNYTIVSKYTLGAETLSVNLGKKANEIIIADAYKSISVVADDTYPYAIDWKTGDILRWNGENYEVEWFYNEKLGQYYNWTGVHESNVEQLIGINIMDAADVAALKAEIADILAADDYFGYKIIAKSNDYLKSAWASLEVFNLDEDALAERGIYEAYRLGKFSVVEAKCSDAGIEDSGDADKKHTAYKFENIKLTDNVTPSCIVAIADGACDKCANDNAHFAEGYAPTQDEDGNYKTGYVVYGYNSTTGEIKIVKEIFDYENRADADSYIATGVVRGHSISNKTITIDNNKVSWNEDDMFVGTPFVKVSDNNNKEIYSDFLYKFYNQFVEYVVVDGYLVDIWTVGEASSYIVVEDFYGIDSEGYIVVSGYDTAELKYNLFRIASCDGWKKGSAYNYEVYEEMLEEDTVLKVLSSSETVDNNGKVYNVEVLVTDDTKDATVATISFADGHRTVGTADPVKVNKDDKYIIISDYKYDAPVSVVSGKVTGTASIDGKILYNDGKLFIIEVNAADAVVGLDAESVPTTFVEITTKPTEAAFDEAYGEYYYYGASVYEYGAKDVFTDKGTTVKATNKKLVKGTIYKVVDGVVVNDNVTGIDFQEIVDRKLAAYDGWVVVAPYTLTASTWDKAEVSKAVSTKLYDTDKYTDLVDKIEKVLYIDRANKKIVEVNVDDKDMTAFGENVVSVVSTVYYNTDSEKVAIVVDSDTMAAKVDAPAVDTPVSAMTVNAIELAEDAYIVAVAEGTSTNDDGVVSVKLDKITVQFYGDEIETDQHATIVNNGYYFGVQGEEDWGLMIDGNVYRDIESIIYDAHRTNAEEACELIKGFTVNVDGKALALNGIDPIQVAFSAFVDGEEVEYVLNLKAVIDAENNISIRFSRTTDDSTIDGIVKEPVELAK